MYAQTNVALLRQLQRLGHAGADLLQVRRAYELAMQLFTAQFRPAGEPFLVHLVRTASILAEHGADRAVIVAGLLHSAYTHGEFGDGRRWPSGAKRAEVAAVIGAESERLVHRYAEFEWLSVLPELPGSIDRLSSQDRTVLLIRLANELEQQVDLPRSCPPIADREAAAHLRRCAEAARRLGNAGLSAALDEAARELADGTATPGSPATNGSLSRAGAVYHGGPRGSFQLPPRSHRLRARVAVLTRLRGSGVVRTLYHATRRLLAG